jgi:hypothetical protein
MPVPAPFTVLPTTWALGLVISSPYGYALDTSLLRYVIVFLETVHAPATAMATPGTVQQLL